MELDSKPYGAVSAGRHLHVWGYTLTLWCFALWIAFPALLVGLGSGVGIGYGAFHDVGCGGVENFAHDPSAIPPELERMLRHDVVVPNGCNECALGAIPVWLAPGDMCTMQDDEHRLKEYPRLQHCTTKYARDYNPTHHVKSCLTINDLSFLYGTDPPHCHSNATDLQQYFFYQMEEGLLFCAALTAADVKGAASVVAAVKAMKAANAAKILVWLQAQIKAHMIAQEAPQPDFYSPT